MNSIHGGALMIGGYRLGHLLARGGNARVYRAFQPAEHREIALKVIHLEPGTSENNQFWARFTAEARIVAALEHLHIVSIYDYGIDTDSNTAYVAMRLMRGGTLADLLKKAGRLPRERVELIFKQIAAGLEFAHSRGIIHCDLKPNNILLDEHGNAYLGDFGMARILAGAVKDESNGIRGTPAYLAPEQIRHELIGEYTDVYSLGLILYEMITGTPAFSARDNNLTALLTKQLFQQPEQARRINHSIPAQMDTVITHAIAKASDARYPSISALAQAVSDALDVWTQRTAQREKRFTLAAFAIILITIWIVIQVAVRTINQPYFSAASVRWGERGIPDQTRPTDIEITQAQSAATNDGFIAYIACSTDNSVVQAAINEMHALATEYGIGFRVFDAQRDVYILVTQMQFARAAGARALIVCSLNANLIDTAIREAADAGLPIVALSAQPIPGAVTVINDNEQTGRVLGEAAARYALTYYPNPGDLTAIVMTDAASDIMAMRARGLIDGLLDGAELAALSIVDAAVTTNQQGAAEYMDRLMDNHTPFHFVLTPNDAATLGVISALEAAGVPSQTHDPHTVNVFAVSTGTNAALWMEQGRYVRGYVEINRRLTTETAFNATVKLMGGGSLPEILLVPAEDLIIETQRP